MSRELFQQERRDQIVAQLGQAGRVSVVELSKQFSVTPATIRTDLDALAADRLLNRTHGGALALDEERLELSFDSRRRLQAGQKSRIGAAAAGMVEDGEAIILDASTTALAVAIQLQERRELTVLTNGLLIALTLIDVPGITVVMPGGFVRRDSASMVGDEGHEFIERFNFQRGIFGAKGFTLEEGLTDVNAAEVSIKRDMVAHARQVVAVVDSSKWGRVGFASFASIDQLDCVITDAGAPSDMIAAVREDGVDVVVV
jgi:DeoR family transcriptional regulator of aga operon/DeoR family fructose operon transcriptional repressor